ncbi:3D domain-containing protein [Clostridium sp. DSM 100503]|uniref:G5 and 3D domain-containing protein n=1 Tax=Clostridium sp. DSM 100503 TaxID=2963282 RepID=UPI002149F0C5|nr:G5 and 3D domain-containing protein [Clostridium sp. DSM 100503]MCR1951033.1 3D domain-containing protein [Clostridium sp. DSM 100503]
MVEKCKEYMKNNFSNGPKAKILIGVVLAAIVLSVTFINMRKTVTMKIDGKEETFVTYKGTVKDLLDTKGVEVNPKDKVQPALNGKVSEGDTISIKRAVSVELTVGDKQVKIDTAEDTIEEMLEVEKEELKNQGIEFNENLDEIAPALSTKITSDLKINLVKVEVKKELAKEAIDFDVVVESDENLDSGLEEVRQDGASGEKEVTYEIVYKNGAEFSRSVKSSKVLAEPVNKVIAQGTRKAFASRDGQLLNYKSVIYCESTAYSGGGITATGSVPVRDPNGISTIAVDPRVIPLGSLVYVEGYGKAVAADTGGAIKGNIIDVYVNSEAEAYTDWGRKYNVPVYILAYPGEW